jgi:hypothetical protein
VEASFEATILCAKMLSNNIVNVNIVELQNIQNLDGPKRDVPLWAAYIKKKEIKKRSPSRKHYKQKGQSGSRERSRGNCLRCESLHQGACPAIDEVQQFGHNARACWAGKPFTSVSAASIAVPTVKKTGVVPVAKQIKVVPVADQKENLTPGTTRSVKIASINNQEKLELGQVEIDIRNRSRQKIQALPDVGTNITALQPEI